ncbi:MAG: molybdopterin-binding protein [Alphaproteobacteria bacterium]|nr:molybdopterin-binding protein [Alphaproteobacteria bacterium]
MAEHTKTACVVIIGNEILTGRTQDVNLNYIGKKLMQKGIKLMQARVISDIEGDIIKTVNEVRAAYDYVFTTGGIGPTHDDITADCVARAFGVSIDVNEDARQILIAHYKGVEHLNEGRLRMARIPEGASLIPNPVSSAPGFCLGNVYVMAGVPSVMQAMLDGVLSKLQGGPAIKSWTITSLVPESVIAKELGEIAAKYPDLDIGSYPYFRAGGFGLSLVVRGQEESVISAATQDLCLLIKRHGGEPTVHQE